MMTFVTSDDLLECALSLDYKRLGKQRVEGYQIWRTLKGITHGWKNHPAVKMWEGYTCALALYTNTMIMVWKWRGYRNNMKLLPHCKDPPFPPWWGWEPLISSHRASLNRKDSFYAFIPSEYDKYGYIWPSKVPFDFQWKDIRIDQDELPWIPRW